MINMSVCLVTFKERRELIKSLIPRIRETIPAEVDIILAVNGNYDEIMPEDYRTDMLRLSMENKNVYPIVCADFFSLSKLWNTIVLFSKTEYNFIMTDDLVISNPSVYKIASDFAEGTGEQFFTINNGFSHFVVTKSMLHQIGYFDERLLAHGEEDGDIVHRYIKMFGRGIPSLMVDGFYNGAAYHLQMTHSDNHTGNKPTINREIAKIKYTDDPNGICGMNPTPLSSTGVLEDYQQYPYEPFVRRNRFNIKKFEKVILDE